MRGTVEVVAPVRADLSAGFPDVEPFCRDRPGYVVNVALDLTVRASLRPSRVGEPVATTLPQRLVAATACELGVPAAVDVHVTTPGLTPGSGLGSSGALSVAIALGLLHETDAPDRAWSAADVVDLAVRAERTAGVFGGTQDQWASACGGIGTVRQFRGSGTREDLVLPARLGDHVALVHPGGTRDSGAIVGAVAAGAETSRAAAVIEDMNATALRMATALLAADLIEVAALVDESCALLAGLHPGIVSAGTRRVLRSAPGVMGAKPCGAGGSSATWVVLRDPESRPEFETFVASRGLTIVPATLSTQGVRLLDGR